MGNTKIQQIKVSEKKIKTEKSDHVYHRFQLINGEHPIKSLIPEAAVCYQARSRKGGEVAFFNYQLAKEIGLLEENHPEQLNDVLRESILYTFGIVIINEFDQMNKIQFPKEDIRPNTYMATRYLQLQHPCKKGTTSGDGRSIWNGTISHRGKTYDVSSCGTGATKLSPASNINKKFYQTGDPSVSYGCGYSEKDEGLGALFFSEILSRNGLKTERVLAIIEFEKGLSINVRVHENLLRPSHFFNHLKQGNLPVLKKMVDYYISRETSNHQWPLSLKLEQDKYQFLLKTVSKTFAEMSANFEDQYLFCWLDWDGDNILMDGGIIDYGSVRQFGLYHHEYRYDDVERMSTSIKEQKLKARYIVQTFAQITDYLIHQKKRPIEDFKNDPALVQFDEMFDYYKLRNALYKIGIAPKYFDDLILNYGQVLKNYQEDFSYFEMAKSITGPKKVPDGINWNAVFCMRDILRELPQMLLSRGVQGRLNDEEFIDIIKSSYATKDDLKVSPKRSQKILSFQSHYLEIVKYASKFADCSTEKMLLEISMRSSVINKYDRVTGDSITTIVAKIMNKKPKLKADEIAEILKEFTLYQNLNPEINKGVSNFEKAKEHSKIVKNILQIVRDFREGI